MINPVIARRELQLLARSPVLFRSRFWTGVVTLVAGTAFAIVYSRVGNVTGPFLGMVGYMLSLTCMFTGAQITSDSIAKEKRDGTLGLLFLTPLRSWEITTGKLVAFSLAAFSRIFVLFPLLSLLMIVGGTAPLDVVRTALGLLNILFAAACIGLYGSTVTDDQKRAAGRATVLVLFFWWGLPLLAQVNGRFGGPRWLNDLLLGFSFHTGLVPTFIMPLPASSKPWLNMACTHLLGWIFLLVATLRTRHIWQDQPKRKRFSLKAGWERLSRGSAQARLRLRRLLLDRNPFLWLASRGQFRSFGLWLLTCGILAFSVWIYFSTGRDVMPMIVFWALLTLSHRFVAASVGGSQLLKEQEQGTIEMLLSTPLSARDVLRGQFQAAARQFRGPVLIIISLHMVVPLLLFGHRKVSIPIVIMVVAVSLLFYLFDLYTAIWLSMLAAVTSRNPKSAPGAAMARLFGLPFLAVVTTTVATALLNTFLGLSLRIPPLFALVSLAALIVGNNIYWVCYTRKALPNLLRTYAFRRYSPEEELSFFGRLGRTLGQTFNFRPSIAAR